MRSVTTHSEAWAQQKEALIGRQARRSGSPLEFIQEILHFVLTETDAERAVLYLFDDDAPSLTSIRKRQLELETQFELVATASLGFPDTAQMLHQLFLSTKSVPEAAIELKQRLPNLAYPCIETIPFLSSESKIAGIIAIYARRNPEAVALASQELKPILNEASIMVDYVIDRFLQHDLVGLNGFGLKTVSFDTIGGMCRMIEHTRTLLACQGISFFVRNATTDNEVFSLTASSPNSMPQEPIGYSAEDNNITARALTYKKTSIIHNAPEVRRRVEGLDLPKWSELPKGSVDRSVMFVPVIRGNNIVALLRCTNNAYSDGCRTVIPISVGQHSDFSRTPFRFISDSVPG